MLFYRFAKINLLVYQTQYSILQKIMICRLSPSKAIEDFVIK